MGAALSKVTLVMWCTLGLALLLSVSPMPEHLEVARPLWLALVFTFWALTYPHKVGLLSAWCLGIAQDVLYGTVFGQHAITLTLIVFLVLTLEQRLKLFPLWQQSAALIVIYGVAQLVLLWLSTLSGMRPELSYYVIPVLVSSLLWPWLFLLLINLQRLRNFR